MLIVSDFYNNGVPAGGLSPVISILDLETDTLIIDEAAMVASTEFTNYYYYNFSAYDSTKKYVFKVDGGATLPDADRYQSGVNELGTIESHLIQLRKIQEGRWQIVNNQMIFYDSDQSTPILTFDLFDRNGQPANKNIYDKRPV